jgi:hypothetical protein
LRLGVLTRLADKLLHALLTSVQIRVRLHLPNGLNVCAQIAHAICKVAAAAEINPRIESEAQAFFQASGAEHDGSNRLPALPDQAANGHL